MFRVCRGSRVSTCNQGKCECVTDANGDWDREYSIVVFYRVILLDSFWRKMLHQLEHANTLFDDTDVPCGSRLFVALVQPTFFLGCRRTKAIGGRRARTVATQHDWVHISPTCRHADIWIPFYSPLMPERLELWCQCAPEQGRQCTKESCRVRRSGCQTC